jgi:hypothetical protein
MSFSSLRLAVKCHMVLQSWLSLCQNSFETPLTLLELIVLLVCGLSEAQAIMNNELERVWKERSWPNLRYYPEILPEVLRNTTKDLSQNNRSMDQDLKPRPSDIHRTSCVQFINMITS